MKKLLLIAAAMGINVAIANEGMWQPHQLPEISKDLKKAGLKLNAKDLTNLTGFPMGAIVSLGGCTASFVSDKGLVVTNHHCAYGSIVHNSTKENNILENGFLAKEFKDEVQASPGSRVYVTEDIVKVTKQVKSGITDNMTGTERYQHIDKIQKQLVAECESNKDFRCSVVNFHGGLEYYLFKQLMIRDVRLVHAPPRNVGKYGGDIDNWMWPRHTGDYAFYRAYVGKDGKPADYSESNVPYQPKHHLKVNAESVSDGDYVMVIGYPGRTNRYRTANEVKNTFTESYALTKELMGSLIKSIKDNSEEGSNERIGYESLIAGLANYEKNRGSMMESYYKGTTQQRKSALDKSLRDWVNESKSRKNKYSSAINELDELVKEGHANYQRDTILSFAGVSSMLSASERLYRLALEKQKPDMERERGYQERDMTRFTQSMKAISKRYYAPVDQAMLMNLMSRYAKLPAEQRNKDLDRFFNIDDGYSESRLDKKLSSMYAKTQLGDEEKRLAWMEKTVADFEKSEDPFIQYAVKTYKARKALEDAEKDLSGKLNAVRPKYMEAIIAYNKAKGLPIYADANSTLRVTFGNVKGYSPKDGMYAVPFTRLEGLLEKETGEWPFKSPQKILDLVKKKQYGDYYKKEIDSVPVNYLSTLDITGGNSGSPTLNNKAELVGLVFDGVYESIIGDWDYDPQLNRAIHVDSRYMLWMMEYVDGATNLIEEMDIVR
ncbi:S46 family peptidase [Aliikangiella marina]|uniref:Dipeptidyl-peptidase n=1 Tax=Aliikangiella marina TaxID=1712262 RepID=A0A545T9R4_9GAMM|nr:S46 family peptidase [Aliikangiella marina]TQV73952.1 S46 family peptidase [Aliikangiella marina]